MQIERKQRTTFYIQLELSEDEANELQEAISETLEGIGKSHVSLFPWRATKTLEALRTHVRNSLGL